MADKTKAVFASAPGPVPAAAPPAEVQAPAPPPPAPVVPRLLEGSLGRRPFRPTHGVVVNVGDLCARLGDGSACPASAWPRTGNPEFDRRAFAATFLGCSAGALDPRRPRAAGQPPLSHEAGGLWAFPCKGTVAKGDPLGPAIDPAASTLSPTLLETCPPDQAVAEAIAAEGGTWRVKVRKPADGE